MLPYLIPAHPKRNPHHPCAPFQNESAEILRLALTSVQVSQATTSVNPQTSNDVRVSSTSAFWTFPSCASPSLALGHNLRYARLLRLRVGLSAIVLGQWPVG